MLWQLPATQLAGLIRSREISAREAVQAALERLNDGRLLWLEIRSSDSTVCRAGDYGIWSL
jgi:Asp-tRNA(Asn)/Glu-tRNA(Gln) amidotransferase A subunit family amidase